MIDIELINEAYAAGTAQGYSPEFIDTDIRSYAADYFGRIRNEVAERSNTRIRMASPPLEFYRQTFNEEIIREETTEVLLENGISPFSLASDVEFAVKINFQKVVWNI